MANLLATNPSTAPESAQKGRVFLMDTMSFIFRAYHAMARQRPMSTKTGLPTAATYVFVNMLRKLREDLLPNTWLRCSTSPVRPSATSRPRPSPPSASSTSRRRLYRKSSTTATRRNRKEMPDDLVQQVPYIRRALEAYRIPILEYPGFEADDVIGTLAARLPSVVSGVCRLQRQGHAAAGE